MHKTQQNIVFGSGNVLFLMHCYAVVLECHYLDLSFIFIFDVYLFSTCQSFIITSHSTNLKKILFYLLYLRLFLLDFFKYFKNSGTSSSCHKVAVCSPLFTCVQLLSLSTCDSKCFKTILLFFHAFVLTENSIYMENSISKTLLISYLSNYLYSFILFLVLQMHILIYLFSLKLFLLYVFFFPSISIINFKINSAHSKCSFNKMCTAHIIILLFLIILLLI